VAVRAAVPDASRPRAAERYAQDAFHAVWRRADSLPPRGAGRVPDPGSWPICRNAAIRLAPHSAASRGEREVSFDAAPELLADCEGRRAGRRCASRRALCAKAVAEFAYRSQRDVLSSSSGAGYSQKRDPPRAEDPIGTVRARVRSRNDKASRASVLDWMSMAHGTRHPTRRTSRLRARWVRARPTRSSRRPTSRGATSARGICGSGSRTQLYERPLWAPCR